MGSYVARHNAKLLRGVSKNPKESEPPSCNCLKSLKKDCPMPDACKQDGVIYEAKVYSSNGNEETYVGLAKHFKKRWYKHKRSFEKPTPENSTTLSTYYLKEMNEGRNPIIEWTILEKNIPDYNPITKRCQLCIREKFNIIFKPELCSLNSRQELFAHCRHIKTKLIEAHPD